MLFYSGYINEPIITQAANVECRTDSSLMHCINPWGVFCFLSGDEINSLGKVACCYCHLIQGRYLLCHDFVSETLQLMIIPCNVLNSTYMFHLEICLLQNPNMKAKLNMLNWININTIKFIYFVYVWSKFPTLLQSLNDTLVCIVKLLQIRFFWF
jgi:hypothetical protein